MSRTTALPPVARIEYLRRLVLEVRVAALEAQLERSRRRRDAVIEHYERLVDEQEGPVFSWRPR